MATFGQILTHSRLTKNLGAHALFVTLCWLFLPDAEAQNEVDYLRYAHLETAGSVRSWGMGGAFGALGADLGSLHANPGGLGMYRRGDLGMALGVATVRAQILQGTSAERRSATRATLPSAGLVLTYPTIHPDWPFFSLGVTYTQRANLDRNTTINPTAQESSLLEVFSNLADGVSPDDFGMSTALSMYSSLAWDTYLIDPLDPTETSPTSYITAIPDGKVSVSRLSEASGTVGETAISLGGAFRDRLFFGVTFGLPRVDFTEITRTRETPRTDSLPLQEWTMAEELQIEGSGFNAKLGVVGVVSDWLRLGLAYHSPTRLRIGESFVTRMESFFDNGTDFNRTSPTRSNSYIVRTPARLIGSASFLMGKAGIIVADIERIDYSGGELRPTAFAGLDAPNYAPVNDVIQEIHDISYIARAGVEIRIQDHYRLRLGASYETSPYNPILADVQEAMERYTGTGGFGWRKDKYYLNVAYRRAWYAQDVYPFGNYVDDDPGTTRISHGTVIFGGGIRL